MIQTIQTILDQSRPEIPVGLSSRILHTIELEAARRARFRMRLASWCTLSSATVFLISIVVAGESFISSDFWQIASLLFSDLSLVMSYSEEFFLSLAETFPAASASILLAPLFLYAVSIAFRSKYILLATNPEKLQFSTTHP